MTDSRKAEPAIQAYSSEKDFSRQGSPFCVGWGAWKNMKNHEKPYNRSFARGTFSYFKIQWILHPDFRNCTFKNHTTGLCPRKCNSSARHQNLRSGTFPSRARSKATLPLTGTAKSRCARGKWRLYLVKFSQSSLFNLIHCSEVAFSIFPFA